MSTAAAPDPVSWRHGGFVAAATFAAGLLGYAVNLILSHALGPARFGELSALFALVILASVPGTAMQAAIARALSHGGSRQTIPALLGEAAQLSLAVGILVVALAPLLRAMLDVQSWASLCWLAILLVPTTMSFGYLGVLQGQQRFTAFGRLLVLVQVCRVAGAAVAALTGTGVPGALSITAVFTTLLVGGQAMSMTAVRLRVHPVMIRSVLARDAGAVLGVLMISNLDLILARHYLPAHDGGLYAAGNLVAKAAFWAPSFVSVVAYPALARPNERAGALSRGGRVLAALGALTVAAAAVGAPLVPVIIGAAYRPIEGIAWLFALQGAALAGVLFGVYAGLAIHRRGLAVAVWAAAAVEATIVSVWWHESIRQILAVAVCAALALVVIAFAVAAREYRATSRSRARDARYEPPDFAGHGDGA